jgi:hypothetical protein
LDWQYGQKQKGMYINGHECEDVVQYWNEFIKRWKGYEKCMVLYDDNGNIASTPQGFPVPQGAHFCLVPITHDELTFFQEDCQTEIWSHKSAGAAPVKKEEGTSLMISDFMMSEWGRLKDNEEEVLYLISLSVHAQSSQ